jgi:hypothetical protein
MSGLSPDNKGGNQGSEEQFEDTFAGGGISVHDGF